ncbi:MAG TPA: glycogen synthase GlgA [Clostridiales bacterium]|nr:glycogen synthase GlgA [Clostridiales bacterium]
MNKKLKILYVSSEVDPFVKTGGLADVAGALPKTIAHENCDIRVVIPKYSAIDEKYKKDMKHVVDHSVHLDWRTQESSVFEYDYKEQEQDKELKCYFIGNDYYFDRWNVYGEYDDAERFGFFARAVLEMLPKIGFQPDIIHCNDWQTGIICLLLNDQYKFDEFYTNMKTVFSIHNMRYQGNFPAEVLNIIGLNHGYNNPDSIEFYGGISYMKAGLKYADIITTVSGTYAKEIQMVEYGYGMDGLIRKRNDALYGIINGVDYKKFNPEVDKNIYENYNKDSLNIKKHNKERLQEELGLPKRDVPMIGFASRLTEQKGMRLIDEAMEDLMSLDIQLVLVGTGEWHFEEMFRYMQSRWPEKVSANIKFDEPLAQKIQAASDMYLVPSLFEPCGLTQLYAYKYGSVPIVRKTGGLADTVWHYNLHEKSGTGFTFDNYNSWEMMNTIKYAVDVYNNYQGDWIELVRKNMDMDFSWTSSAKKYIALYKKISQDNK